MAANNGYAWIRFTRAEYAAARPENAHHMILPADDHDVEMCSDACDWQLFPEGRPGQWYTVDLECDPDAPGRWSLTATPRDADWEVAWAARTTIVRDVPDARVYGPVWGDIFPEAQAGPGGVRYRADWDDEPIDPPGIFDDAVAEVIALAHERMMAAVRAAAASAKGSGGC